jgi:hypothetical protein
MPDLVALANLGLIRHSLIWQVHFKLDWATVWLPITDPATTVMPHLFCDNLQLGMMPQGSQAQLSFHLARGIRHDEPEFRDPNGEDIQFTIDAVGGYVMVECFEDEQARQENNPFIPPWVGIITDCNRDLEGADNVLKYTAHGLEWLLTRNRLTTSWVQDSAWLEVEIGRALPFNGRGSCRDHHAITTPNCTKLKGERDAHIFSRDPLEPLFTIPWSAWHILHYLIKYHPPKSIQGRQFADQANAAIPWAVPEDAGTDVTGLKWHQPQQLDCDGRTLAEIISQVIDPRRLSTWWVEVDTDVYPNVVNIRVAALNEADIELGDEDIVANGRQVTVSCLEDPGTKLSTLSESLANQYDRVVVRGARIGTCFTVSIADGTLEKDWTDAEETIYIDGASAAGDYPAGKAEREARNDTIRKSDQVKRVYSHFRIPQDWDGSATNVIGGDSHLALPYPYALDDPDANDPDDFWYPGLRLENYLPLYESTDYSGSAIQDRITAMIEGDLAASSFDTTLPDGSAAPLKRPLIVLKLGASGGDRYEQVEKLSSHNEKYRSGLGRHHCCSTTCQEDSAGFVLTVHGALAHALASADFIPATAPPSSDRPDLDWNYLIATVFLQTDSHVEQSIPETPDNTLDCERVLTIDLPQYRFDYVVPTTVVALEDGALVHSDGGPVRDDRNKLAGIARMAWQWYSTTRRAIRLTYRGLDDTLALGQMVTTLDGYTVNSVITMVTYDCVQNLSSIHTQFGELDFAEVGSRRR